MDASGRSGIAGGLAMKHLSLVTLTVQNSALILVMHYSRVMPLVDGQRYHASTSVLLSEVIKLAISLTVALYDISTRLPVNTSASTLFRSLFSAVFTNESWKLAIPALIYTLQNTLQYVAVSNLDAATFQVTYQLKILTTAIFSVMMLGRTLSTRRWISLLLLIIGVSIVQFPSRSGSPDPAPLSAGKSEETWRRSLGHFAGVGKHAVAALSKRSAAFQDIKRDVGIHHPQMNKSVGLAAVIVACALSGLAGVTFEKILKESSTGNASLWIRNVQLSFWSLFPALFIGVIFVDGEKIAKTGFFAGYNWVVWTAISFQALGGVIVALVIKYADNIAKNFATSISIVISSLVSAYCFDFEVTTSFLMGTSVVLSATYIYSSQDMKRSAPIRISDFEKITVEGNSMYVDEDKSPSSLGKSLLNGEGCSSLRPSTPTMDLPHPGQNSKRQD